MREYQDLLRLVLEKGRPRSDRTGTGTLSVFGAQARFDLRDSFPLLTTKKLHLKSIIHELLWFLSGDTNVGYLQEQGVTIWNEWADEQGDLGRVYGAQWRDWRGPDDERIDQIDRVIEQIKKKPDSRRLIVTAWNPAEVDTMALPPCHALFQFHVQDGALELPALSTERGSFSRRAFQHRELRAPHADGRAGLRPNEWRIHSHLWRSASLPESPRAGA